MDGDQKQGTKPFYSVQEMSDMLNVHHSTVKRMIADGQLDAVKVGRLWRIKGESVRKLVEGNGQSS